MKKKKYKNSVKKIFKKHENLYKKYCILCISSYTYIHARVKVYKCIIQEIIDIKVRRTYRKVWVRNIYKCITVMNCAYDSVRSADKAYWLQSLMLAALFACAPMEIKSCWTSDLIRGPWSWYRKEHFIFILISYCCNQLHAHL